MRRALKLWHRYFGLAAAAWLGLLALTGTILVFHKEIDGWLNPGLVMLTDEQLAPTAGQPRPTLAQLADRVEARWPGAKVHYWIFSRDPRRSASLWTETPDGTDSGIGSDTEILVNPYTGEILGERKPGAWIFDRAHIVPFVYQLHLDLHLGPTMRTFLGIVALLWVFDHVAGAVLALPRLARWRDAFRIRWQAGSDKRVFDYHRALAMWLLPVTLTLAITGVAFSLTTPFTWAVSLVSEPTPRVERDRPALPTPLMEPPVSVNAAAAMVDAHSNGAATDSVYYLADKGIWWFRLFDANDIDEYGRRWVFIDARSGALIDDRHMAAGTLGDQILAWQLPLHNGHVLGLPGRIAVFLAGLTTFVLCVTGVMIFARRLRARGQVSRRQGNVEPTARAATISR